MRHPPTTVQPRAMRVSENREVSHSYVLMVQHLIERCLLLYMDRNDCIRALAKHARVKPVITMTVWRELEHENPEFFATYSKQQSDRRVQSFSQLLEDATARLCAQKLNQCAHLMRNSRREKASGYPTGLVTST